VSALAGVRKRHTSIALGLAVVAVIGAIAAGYVGVKALDQYRGGRLVTPSLPLVMLPDTPVAVLGATDASGALAAVAVLVLNPASPGGKVVPVPVSLDVAGGFGTERFTLADEFAEGGAEQLLTAVERAMGLTVGYVQVDDPDALEARLGPFVPLVVEGGSLQADEAAAQFVGADREEPAATAGERMPEVVAVWRALANSVDQGRAIGEQADVVDSMDSLWSKLVRGEVEVREIPFSRLQPENNPADVDAVVLDVADATLVFASIAPRAVSGLQPGLSYLIQAPPGSETKVRELIAAILFTQGNVKVVTFDGPVQQQSDIIVYDEKNRTDAEATNDLLGEVAFPKPTRAVDGVQVAIVLGQDYLSS
jgi:hypothetical protein